MEKADEFANPTRRKLISLAINNAKKSWRTTYHWNRVTTDEARRHRRFEP